jgi:8-oxo-dGTP pyrophosphatase MutT (NUDIX family)
MLRVVGCFLEYDGRFVLLHRHAHKPDGNTWGLPAGKVEEGETDADALLRELREETGYQADKSELLYLREDTYQFDHGSVEFVVYKVVLSRPHAVQIEENAHQSYKWVRPSEGYAMPDLIPGLHTVIERVGYR